MIGDGGGAKITTHQNATGPILGVKIRNSKVDFKTGNDFFYSAKSLSRNK